jgi:nitrate/nitrite-specific signal transduction histidine kinase
MQTLDIAQQASMESNNDSQDDCCTAYKLLNTTLFGILTKPDSTDPYLPMLSSIKDLLLIQTSAIYHYAIHDLQATLIASSGDISNYGLSVQNFARSLEHARSTSGLWYSADNQPNLLVKATRINCEASVEYAVLVLICESAQKVRETRDQVVEILAQGFADVICATRLAQVNHRRALQQERATISRELHDSLAQSLTYLKIQASRLQSIFKNGLAENQRDSAEFELVVQELRSNLKVAYRQLRELMTIFRLTMNGENFNQAIEESIDEFGKRSNIVFELDNRLGSDELTTDEEMQIQHIIREALSNTVRHSHAKRARVMLRQDRGHCIQISIEDDGVGIDQMQRRAKHHGLIIMQERSQTLNGKFTVEEQSSGGTKITISFKPQKSAQSVQQELRSSKAMADAGDD